MRHEICDRKKNVNNAFAMYFLSRLAYLKILAIIGIEVADVLCKDEIGTES